MTVDNYYHVILVGQLDLDWYDILAFILTFSYVVLECQLMSQLTCAVKNSSSRSEKLKCYFSDTDLTFKFFSHIILLMGMILKVTTKVETLVDRVRVRARWVQLLGI